MASFQKLVFLFALVLSIIYFSQAAPLRVRRVRPRDDPAPAVVPVALDLKPQQESFNFDLDSSLALPNSTVTPLQTIPENCAQYNTPEGECSTQFEAVNVTYDDCGDPWTVCRCSNANMTMDTAVGLLGKVPVGLRRFVATLVIVPGNVTRAYTLTTGDVHVFINDTAFTAKELVHESAHALDWSRESPPMSGTSDWLNAIKSDSCVPDVYAATSAGEDFAQVAVMKVYSLTHGDTLPSGWSIDCMSHQMEYMSGLPVFNKQELFGSTCAIPGSDTGSRHTTPPLVNPMRLPPDLPAQNLPVIPKNETLDVPTNTAEKSPHVDNAASSVVINVKLALLLASGVFAGSLFW